MAIEEQARVRFHGVLDDRNVSAVALWRGRALMVTDEVTRDGNVIQMFDAAGDEFRAAAQGPIKLDAPASSPDSADPGKDATKDAAKDAAKKKLPEMDLEGISVSGDSVFVVGSHSAKRKRVDPTKDHDKNRAALMGAPEAEPSRDVLLRIALDSEGRATVIERASLRGFLETAEPFKSCCAIASKENGPDIEGLAVVGDRLFVGFRGPVLRGNFAPVLTCKFGKPIEDPALLFVDLGGRGIRDLAEVKDGLLVLAGPVGDGPGSYQVYLWDGKDGVPGMNPPASANGNGKGLRLIGDLPTVDGAKAEGLALLAEAAAHWDVLVVFDGLSDGEAIRYRVPKG
jgi:hypothetical protein